MIAFGLFIGIVFPFFAKAVLRQNPNPLSSQFILLCLGAGLLVGLVNYLLFHLVISKELDRIIRGMQSISSNIKDNLFQPLYKDQPCELEVTSNDRLGEVILAFNSMGQAIDHRQRRERELREIMNTLSDSVDFTFTGQLILNHLPAPQAWQHALLYIRDENEYHCIAIKAINRSSVQETLPEKSITFLDNANNNQYQTFKTKATCFASLELIVKNKVCRSNYITVISLKEQQKQLGFIITACNHFSPLNDINRQLCQTYCSHVFPYLRNVLLHKKIEKIAAIDELSQALTRRAGMRRLEEEYSAAIRHKMPLSIIILDIDHFKKVNDIYGHQAGDMVIQELCARILSHLRDEDILFRYGGEEFILILPFTNLTEGAVCAERIRHMVSQKPFAATQEELQIRISLGVSSLEPHQNVEMEQLITMADKALYQAKQEGRNQVVVQTESSTMALREYLKIQQGHLVQ